MDLSTEVILRWDKPAPEHVALFAEGGVTALWLAQRDAPVERACAAAGIHVLAPDDVRLLKMEQLENVTDRSNVVIKDGVWAGATYASTREAIRAGATARPWVEANGFRIGYLHALYPEMRPVLGYQMDEEAGVKPGKPPALSRLEAALVEAWMSGGNYVLSLLPEHQQSLIAGQAEARKVWRALGRTARWLRENIALLRQPTLPNITMLVESGETTSELASLMYRQNTSPLLVRSDALPAPAPECKVLVTAGIRPPAAELRARMLAYAKAGATVVTDAYGDKAWWRGECKLARPFEDREFYTLGRGRIVAYKEEIQDPGDFALDVLDLAGRERATRMWDYGAVIALATVAPPGGPGKILLKAINYTRPFRYGLIAQVYGRFAKATVFRPEDKPVTLPVAPRGPCTEIVLPALDLLAVVEFA